MHKASNDCITYNSSQYLLSHPSRVSGLKQRGMELENKELSSHPSRVRGLKQPVFDIQHDPLGSHPSRVRGLKPYPLHSLAYFNKETGLNTASLQSFLTQPYRR